MPRQICFVVMPFRVKATGMPAPAPLEVDFDALWEKALRPAIEELGYQPVRADQDLGALIIKEMLERLYFADLVIADLTIPNGNVYYEIGIRHAAKDGGCVLIGANWARPLFDVDQMRQVRYPLTEGIISDATATTVRDVLRDAVPKLATGSSPMFETLEGYPTTVRAERANVMRSVLDELSQFQAAARAVRLEPKDERQHTAATSLRRLYSSTPPLIAAVALEVMYVLRDCAGWTDMLDFIASLPPSLANVPVVVEQRCLAQSNSGDHRAAIAALEELVTKVGPTPERMGLIGGRYKRLATAEQDPAEKRVLLGRAIAAYERGMELDLNAYYPSSNLPRLYRQRGARGDADRAHAAAVVAMAGCLRAKQLNVADEWLRSTLLGMAFDAGDVTAAEDLTEEVAQEGAAQWKLKSTLDDIAVSLGQQADAAVKRKLDAVFGSLQALLPRGEG